MVGSACVVYMGDVVYSWHALGMAVVVVGYRRWLYLKEDCPTLRLTGPSTALTTTLISTHQPTIILGLTGKYVFIKPPSSHIERASAKPENGTRGVRV